jgi:hypothetical protein
MGFASQTSSGVEERMTETIARDALPRRAGSAPSAAQDDRIMALALDLERSQQALYEAADAAGALERLVPVGTPLTIA